MLLLGEHLHKNKKNHINDLNSQLERLNNKFKSKDKGGTDKKIKEEINDMEIRQEKLVFKRINKNDSQGKKRKSSDKSDQRWKGINYDRQLRNEINL